MWLSDLSVKNKSKSEAYLDSFSRILLRGSNMLAKQGHLTNAMEINIKGITLLTYKEDCSSYQPTFDLVLQNAVYFEKLAGKGKISVILFI